MAARPRGLCRIGPAARRRHLRLRRWRAIRRRAAAQGSEQPRQRQGGPQALGRLRNRRSGPCAREHGGEATRQLRHRGAPHGGNCGSGIRKYFPPVSAAPDRGPRSDPPPTPHGAAGRCPEHIQTGGQN